ncbi:A24 family peptidase [Vibrio sp. RW]|uniref:prepilin peptidase n=1 Tax=Vibrio sp. RW TaxID=2998833 RepID=UPI0022CDB9B4|nr:A24 family peptidase [Vibrio sp. RW]MDA0146404.1 A24 family peptidase [Vibrio sp. RW]
MGVELIVGFIIAGSFAAKCTYLISGILPKIEVQEIKQDLSDYIGVEYTQECNSCCLFSQMARQPLFWVPISSTVLKTPFPKSTGFAKYEVLLLEAIAITSLILASIAGVDFTRILFMGLFVAMTASAALVDLSSRFLPDKIVYPLLWIGLFYSTTKTSLVEPNDAILGAFVAYIYMYTFNKITLFKSGHEAFAWGDVRLLSAVGAWVGIGLILPLIVCSLISSFLLKKGAAFGPVIVIWAYVTMVAQTTVVATIL